MQNDRFSSKLLQIQGKWYQEKNPQQNPKPYQKNHKTILHPKTAARSGQLADWGIQREKWGKPDVDIPHGKRVCASVSFLSIPVGELMSFETWNKKTAVELQKRWMDQEHV